MPLTGNGTSVSRLAAWAGFFLVVVALKYAQDILIPFTLAILLSFLLSPVAMRLEHWKIGRVFSVLLVVGAAFCLLGFVGYFVTKQVIDLGQKLPEYRENIRHKAEALSKPGTLARLTRNFKDVGRDITKVTSNISTSTLESSSTLATSTSVVERDGVVARTTTQTRRNSDPRGDGHEEATTHLHVEESSDHPVRVEVVGSSPSPLFQLSNALSPLLPPLATGSVVVVLTIFILIYREDLRDRLIRLIGEGQLNVTTQALDDAATRVSRYLLMQFVVNLTYGIPVGLGLFFIGLPNALLFGSLATVMRFVPYIGPWVAASMPIVLSAAVFDGWSHFGLTVGLFIILELISNNVIEVWLYSRHTGVSQVALLVAATFWTWVWGGLGLMLATPITVCLVVLGKYVPQFEFFNILLSDQQVLAPEVRIYQRLIALKTDEARRLVDEFLEKSSLEDTYQTLLLPVLGLAERDRMRGMLNETRHTELLMHLREIVDDIGERLYHFVGAPALPDDHAAGDAKSAEKSLAARIADVIVPSDSAPAQPISAALPVGYDVLCLPARGEVDEIAARMLMQLLTGRGLRAEVLSNKTLAGEMVEQAAHPNVRLVCISALPPFADLHARYLCKRLRARHTDLKIVVGLWNLQDDPRWASERVGPGCSDAVVISFTAALTQVSSLLAPLIARESERAAHALEPNEA